MQTWALLGLSFNFPLPAFGEHGGVGQILTGLALSLTLFVIVSRFPSELMHRCCRFPLKLDERATRKYK